MRFEQVFYTSLDNVVRYLKAQPLNLGGYTTSSGSGGGPPGGFIGYLPQTRVAYDEAELSSEDIPVSGASILDNLNHIRYRIDDIEATANGIIVENNDVIVSSGVTILDFSTQFTITDVGDRQVTIGLTTSSGTTQSGVFNEELGIQVPGTSFTTLNEFIPGTLQVYYNGVRQGPDKYTETGTTAFTVLFDTYEGDNLFVDYEVTASGSIGHTHSDYVTYEYLYSGYYTQEDTDLLLALKSNTGHTHVLADIEDYDSANTYLNGVAVSGVPEDTQVLAYQESSNTWTPRYVTVNQQYLLTIEGAYLSTSHAGIKPIRIYAHDVTGATVDEIFCAVNTAPATSLVRLDVLKNGVSILTSYLDIAVGEYTASTTDIATATFSKDDYFQIQLVSGDTVASDLTVHIRFSWKA